VLPIWRNKGVCEDVYVCTVCHCNAFSTTAGTATTCIDMEHSQLQLRSDVLVKCFAVNAVTNQLSPRSDTKLLFRCQFHTSALNSSQSLQFSASDLDLDVAAQGCRSLDGLRVEFNLSPTLSPNLLCKYVCFLNGICEIIGRTYARLSRRWSPTALANIRAGLVCMIDIVIERLLSIQISVQLYYSKQF